MNINSPFFKTIQLVAQGCDVKRPGRGGSTLFRECPRGAQGRRALRRLNDAAVARAIETAHNKRLARAAFAALGSAKGGVK